MTHYQQRVKLLRFISSSRVLPMLFVNEEVELWEECGEVDIFTLPLLFSDSSDSNWVLAYFALADQLK
jgi:hypothetical protein